MMTRTKIAEGGHDECPAGTLMAQEVPSVSLSERHQKSEVEKWIHAQTEFPTRKLVFAHFPAIAQKLLRSTYQSLRDAHGDLASKG